MITISRPLQFAAGFVMVWLLLIRALVCINSHTPLPPPHAASTVVHPPYYAN